MHNKHCSARLLNITLVLVCTFTILVSFETDNFFEMHVYKTCYLGMNFFNCHKLPLTFRCFFIAYNEHCQVMIIFHGNCMATF